MCSMTYFRDLDLDHDLRPMFFLIDIRLKLVPVFKTVSSIKKHDGAQIK